MVLGWVLEFLGGCWGFRGSGKECWGYVDSSAEKQQSAEMGTE